MAGPKMVKFIRGKIRALVKDARLDLVSILNTNSKWPAGTLLTPEQATRFQDVADDCQVLLLAKKAR